MAHRSRRALNTNPGEDPSKLSSEVLKLRLQALNLPITGSKGHPLSRLKRATQGNAAAQRRKPQKRLSQPKTRRGRSAQRTAIESQPPGEAENHRRKQNVPSSLEHKQEDSTLSDRASLSSIEEMLEPISRAGHPNCTKFPTGHQLQFCPAFSNQSYRVTIGALCILRVPNTTRNNSKPLHSWHGFSFGSLKASR